MKHILLFSIYFLILKNVSAQYGSFSSSMNQIHSNMAMQSALYNQMMFNYGSSSVSKPQYNEQSGFLITNLNEKKIGTLKFISNNYDLKGVNFITNTSKTLKYLQSEIKYVRLNSKDNSLLYTTNPYTEVYNVKGELFRKICEGKVNIYDNFFKTTEETSAPAYYKLKYSVDSGQIQTISEIKSLYNLLNTKNSSYGILLDSVLGENSKNVALIFDYAILINKIFENELTLPKIKVITVDGIELNTNGTLIPYRLTTTSKSLKSAIHHYFKGELGLILSSDIKNFEVYLKDTSTLKFNKFIFKKTEVFGVEFIFNNKKYVALNDYKDRPEFFSNRNNKLFEHFQFYTLSKNGQLRPITATSYQVQILKDYFRKNYL